MSAPPAFALAASRKPLEPRRTEPTLKPRILLLAAVVACLFAACQKEVPHGPDVWAVVNGKEISHGEVEKYYRDGHIREIAEYCESDVLNTYRGVAPLRTLSWAIVTYRISG